MCSKWRKMCSYRNIIQFGKAINSTNIVQTLNNSSLRNIQISLIRRLCQNTTGVPPKDTSSKESVVRNSSVTAPAFGKYGIFRDEDSPVILDIEEERLKSYKNAVADHAEEEYVGIHLERGVDGVFDIEELVELLKKDSAQDIFVARLPSDLKYVDYIVVVSGKSPRHMLALAEFVRKVFKRKRHVRDPIPKIEGENSKDWIAMDLGNIALHIFSKQSRTVYDLESLWSVGSQYDERCNQPEDPLVELLERHSVYLGDLQPAETRG